MKYKFTFLADFFGCVCPVMCYPGVWSHSTSAQDEKCCKVTSAGLFVVFAVAGVVAVYQHMQPVDVRHASYCHSQQTRHTHHSVQLVDISGLSKTDVLRAVLDAVNPDCNRWTPHECTSNADAAAKFMAASAKAATAAGNFPNLNLPQVFDGAVPIDLTCSHVPAAEFNHLYGPDRLGKIVRALRQAAAATKQQQPLCALDGC